MFAHTNTWKCAWMGTLDYQDIKFSCASSIVKEFSLVDQGQVTNTQYYSVHVRS